MSSEISPRIAAFVAALPLRAGMRILEIGCGPGVAAREVARRIGDGFVLGIDRSDKAIALAVKGSAAEIGAGRLAFRRVPAEEFKLLPDEAAFDLVFAMRVGALDGRHPDAGRRVLARLRKAVRPGGSLFVDTGNPLMRVEL